MSNWNAAGGRPPPIWRKANDLDQRRLPPGRVHGVRGQWPYQTIASGADREPATILGKITASDKYTILAPTATDGSETAAGILYGHAKAAGADVQAVAVVRMAEVKSAELVWPAGITAPQKTAALAELTTLHIIART